MKITTIVVMLVLMLVSLATVALGQTPREDAVWARTVPQGTITLDGVMNEAAWAQAESVTVAWGTTPAMPGSGYRAESGVPVPTDPTHATIKFLVEGDSLYVGIWVPDSSIGAGTFNMFDGFLMNLRNRSSATRPTPATEYFYGWVAEPWADTNTRNPGAPPWFGGDHGVWDGKTHVYGEVNTDTNSLGEPAYDQGWSTELKFSLVPRGYNVSRTEGDVIEWNISIYDADWEWSNGKVGAAYGNRTFFQGPWGNASAYNAARIYAKPSVTTSSGPLPVVGPDFIIQNGASYAAPAMDGKLDENVWKSVQGFDLKYGSDSIRATYPGIGPYRSGQFQPDINGGKATISDPADGTVKWFFKDSMLYLGMESRDKAVWGSNGGYDTWDGVRFVITDRAQRDPDDHSLLRKVYDMHFDSLGDVVLGGDLPYLKDSLNGAEAAMALHSGTTLNNFTDADSGFSAELAINLKKLGYPADRGDGILFVSAVLLDADNFENATDDYSNRVWFFRENGFNDAAPWGYMDPSSLVTGVAEHPQTQLPTTYQLLGNYPNPFNPSTRIGYALPKASQVVLQVYDLLGRMVATQNLGLQEAGIRNLQFNAGNLTSGVYMYRLQFTPSTLTSGKSTLVGKMMLLK